MAILKGFALSDHSDTTLIQQTYSWDHLRRIKAINDLSLLGLTQTFDYDPLGRLASAIGKYGTKTYQYDTKGAGNLTLKDSVLYNYQNHQVTSGVSQTNPQDTLFTAGYDLNGNRVSMSSGGNTFIYTYNELDQLTSISKNQSLTDSMYYNHKGIRYRKSDFINSFTTHYVSPFYTTYIDDEGNSIQTKYIPGTNSIATVTSALTGNFKSGISGIPQVGTLYLYQDHLNSTRLTTNTMGQLSSAFLYEPHGTPYAVIGPDNVNTKFQGKFLDEESGLYYFDARYYDAVTGSFLSADPILSGLTDRYNRYALTSNNPINLIDPTGHQSEDWKTSVVIDAAEIILGAAVSLSGVADPVGSALTTAGVTGLTYSLKNKKTFSWSEWGKAEGISVASSLLTAGAEGIGSMIRNTTELTSDEVTVVRGLLNENSAGTSSEEVDDATTEEHEDTSQTKSRSSSKGLLVMQSIFAGVGEEIYSDSQSADNDQRQQQEETNESNATDVMNSQNTQLNQDTQQNVLNKTGEAIHLSHKAQQGMSVIRNDKATLSKIRFMDEQVNVDPQTLGNKKSKPGKSTVRRYKLWLIKSN
ncbi:MAG: RHS repeat-associated core domain-containing protein [Bacteroidota bacterium]